MNPLPCSARAASRYLHLLTSGSLQILDALQQCECRLGTAEELPDDLVRARELAHRLANAMTADILRARLDTFAADADPTATAS